MTLGPGVPRPGLGESFEDDIGSADRMPPIGTFFENAMRAADASKREGSRGVVGAALGTDSGIAKAVDYGLTLSQRMGEAAVELGGDVASGIVRAATFGSVKPDLTLGALFQKTWEWGGGKGSYRARQEKILRSVEGERGAFLFARELSEEIVGFAAPFGLLGKGTTMVGRGVGFGVKLPQHVMEAAAKPIAGMLGRGTAAALTGMATKVGMTADQVGAAVRSGNLLREVVKRSSIPMKLARWVNGSRAQIAGTAVGLGTMTTLGELGGGADELDFQLGRAPRETTPSEAMWRGMTSAALAAPLVGVGQLANRLEAAMMSRGMERASAEALQHYLKTGKGWTPMVARFAAGALEGLPLDFAMEPQRIVDFARAVSAGDEDAILGHVKHMLGSTLGMAAVRGFRHDERNAWRRTFPDDIKAPPGKVPPTIDRDPYVSELQRQGWKVQDRAEVPPGEPKPDVPRETVLRTPGFEGEIVVRDAGGEVAVELRGDAWKSDRALAEEIGLLASWEGGMQGQKAVAAKDVEQRIWQGDDARDLLERLVARTAGDNMDLRTRGPVEDAIEVEPGVWHHPDRGVAYTRRFGQDSIRSTVSGDAVWRSAKLDHSEPVPRPEPQAREAASKLRDWIERSGLSAPMRTAMARAADFLEHSKPSDEGAAEALAFTRSVMAFPAGLAKASEHPRQFGMLMLRTISGTQSAQDALAELVSQVEGPPPPPVEKGTYKPQGGRFKGEAEGALSEEERASMGSQGVGRLSDAPQPAAEQEAAPLPSQGIGRLTEGPVDVPPGPEEGPLPSQGIGRLTDAPVESPAEMGVDPRQFDVRPERQIGGGPLASRQEAPVAQEFEGGYQGQRSVRGDIRTGEPIVTPAIDEMTTKAPQRGAESGFLAIPIPVEHLTDWVFDNFAVAKKYFHRPVAQEARQVLERLWGQRNATTGDLFRRVFDLRDEFEASLGFNPLTGSRATTVLGRRANRALNKTATAEAMEDLLFYMTRTGNPLRDQRATWSMKSRVRDAKKKPVEDTVADVEKRLPPGAKAIADKMRTLFDELYARAVKTPLVNTPAYVSNYIPQVWRTGPEGRPVTDINSQMLQRESWLENPVFSRQRVLPSYAEGIKLGYVPQTLNPFELLMRHAKLVGDIETAAGFVETLKTTPLQLDSDIMLAMPKDKAPESYSPHNNPLTKGLVFHPELLGGTSRGYSDQSAWDRIGKYAGGLDVLDRALGAAGFKWGDHPIMSGIKALAMASKKLQVSFSFFHAFVLGVENRLLYGLPTMRDLLKGDVQALRSFRTPSAIAQMIVGDYKKTYDVIGSEMAKVAQHHGLQLHGMPSDFVPRALAPFTNLMRRGTALFGTRIGQLGETMASVLDSFEGFNDKMLWDVMLPTLKVTLFDVLKTREERRKGSDLDEQALKVIAHHVNGVMGNTDWNTVWRIPKSVSDLMSGTVMFAWDWTIGNILTGAGRTLQGINQIPSQGIGNMNLRLGTYSMAVGFVKAALFTQALQSLIWAALADDEDYQRLATAGRDEDVPVWENEGKYAWDKMMTVRLPFRDERGAQVVLHPWKQIKEQFDWTFDFQRTLFNKLSTPVRQTVAGLMGAEAPNWPRTANEDLVQIESAGDEVARWTGWLADWFVPFGVANSKTPAGFYGVFSPFPIGRGTTNYKQKEQMALVWAHYAADGDASKLEDIRFLAQGADVNSLDSKKLFAQSLGMARAPLYRTLFQSLDDKDMETAGRAYLGLTRLGATSDDIRESLRGRFDNMIGQDPPSGDLREFMRRNLEARKSILEPVPESRKPLARIRREVVEGWKANRQWVQIVPEASPGSAASR